MYRCTSCKRKIPTSYYICRKCIRNRFRQDFGKWTSGNECIDKFIQETQLKAKQFSKALEWISFDRLRNIKFIGEGGFGTIYKAIWLDGCIVGCDVKKSSKPWIRRFLDINTLDKNEYNIAREEDTKSPLNKDESSGYTVVLKSLNNSSNVNGFLNELKNHIKCNNYNVWSIIRTYGITQDPETSNYMIVIKFANGGDLRSNLNKLKDPYENYQRLMDISKGLLTLHNGNLIHGDLHGGNILLHKKSDSNHTYITDFGLSRLVNEHNNSKEIYGVVPYIAPEVLRRKPYTKAADIYSFGIIMWELTSGVPAFKDVPHEYELVIDICKGRRPKIVEGTPPEYVKLMERCWDPDPKNRPSANELDKFFTSCERIPFPSKLSDESNIKIHPSACYTSRKIDYSTRLDESLDNNEILLLSESLENCRINDAGTNN